MTRSEQLELLLTDVCTTGLQVLRTPRRPAARALHRQAIGQALAWLRADAAAQQAAEAAPQPPAEPDEPSTSQPHYRLPYAD